MRAGLSRPIVVAWLLVALLAGGARADAETAADLEARAFTAVRHKRWCEAVGLFQRAHALGPAAGLLANASLAAQYGGDRAGALAFIEAALHDAPAEKRAEYEGRRTQLKKDLARSGPGTACPGGTVGLPTPEPTPPTPPPVPPAPEPAPPTPPPPTTTTPELPPTTPPTPAPPPAPTGPPLLAMGLTGAGAAIAVAGAVGVVVGALPWFEHDAARQALLDAQARRLNDPTLVDAQAGARSRWEGYGQALVVGGGVALGAGVVAAAAGIVWLAGAE